MSLTIGIDVGGTKLSGGLVDIAGRIVHRIEERVQDRAFEHVCAQIATMIAGLRVGASVEAVGIGAAGLVDPQRSSVIFAPNLGWRREPLRRRIETAVELPVVVENDASAAAWGEYRFGAGRGAASLVAVTVGTGIGGGIVLEGALVRGAAGFAAEFGHMNFERNGRECGCGGRGCWEQYASGNALVREARLLASERRSDAAQLLALGDGTPEGVQGPHITHAATEGDEVAISAFERVGEALGAGMADLVAVVDPDTIVVGGGVSEAGELLMRPAREAFLTELTVAQFRKAPEIRTAELGNDAGIVGSADLARVA